MKYLASAAVLVLATALTTGTANAQTKPPCSDPVQATPAGGGFKFVGVRRPAIAQVKTGDAISIEVSLAPDLARTDTGQEQKKIISVWKCSDRVIAYKAFVEQVGDFHATELPLPETATDVTFKSCSAATKECWIGKFAGDFNKWVTLAPSAKPDVKVRGKYVE